MLEPTLPIPIGDVVLEGDLATVPGGRGTVVFAHGSGSSRHSPRNRHVARALQARALSTLLVDLLTLEVLVLNRTALARLPSSASLEIVPGATHLFEESGTLEQVAELAGDWFARHLGGAAARVGAVSAR